GARPPTLLTVAAIASRETAPSAPLLGSFKSMTSAPQPSAISASAASRTLASNKVMGEPDSEKSMVEQPVEHPAAAATSATAARGAAAGAARTLGTCAVVGSALPEVEETASGRRSPSYDFAKLNLVGVAVGVSNHHRNGLPVPLGGRRSPAMRLDGEHLVGAD